MSADSPPPDPLSPPDLIRCFTRGASLPTLGDKKTDRRNEDDSDDVATTRSRLRQVVDLISEPRVVQRSQVSEAVWRPDDGLCTVTKPVGKHWETMGVMARGRMHLRPEEALFLMESNQLMLTDGDGGVVSVQRAYEVLIGSSEERMGQVRCSLGEYRTYSYLSRLGYKVIRHVIRKSDDQDDEVQILGQSLTTPDDDSDSRRILDRIPNCYKRTRITLTTPPTELLPYRAWPKKKSYVVELKKQQEEEPMKREVTGDTVALRRKSRMEDFIPVPGTSNDGGGGSRRQWGSVNFDEQNPWAEASVPGPAAPAAVGPVMGQSVNFRGPKRPQLQDKRWNKWKRGQKWSKNLQQQQQHSYRGRGGKLKMMKRRFNASANDEGEDETGIGTNSDASSFKKKKFQQNLPASDSRSDDGERRPRKRKFVPKSRLVRNPLAVNGNNAVDNPTPSCSFSASGIRDTQTASEKLVTLSDDDDDDDDDDLMVVSPSDPVIPKSLTEGPLSALWSGKTKPLLQPKDAKSVAHIFKKIALNQDTLSPQSKEMRNQNLKVSFDVYSPGGLTLRKSSPRIPNYRIVVVSSSDPIPCHDDLARLVGDLRDEVPLLCAVCSGNAGSIAFYCFSKVALPTDITMG